MPLYDLFCPVCKTTEEKLIMNRNDSENLHCSKCDTKLERVPGKFGFNLQGHGWSKPGTTNYN